jgi:hypothetical protein
VETSAYGKPLNVHIVTLVEKTTHWLLLFGTLILLTVLDSFRAPENQLTARTYIGAIHLYQRLGCPVLKGRVVCRFSPSCSE